MILKNKLLIILILILIIISALIYVFRSDIFKKSSVNSHLDSSENIVKLVIEPEYESYFIDQDIWLKVIVVNNSSDNYFLKMPLIRSVVSFKGISPSGKIYEDSLKININEPTDSLKLIPGNSFEKVMPLNIETKRFFYPENTERENFKIIAKYQNLSSNELSISVSEPVGIDKELYEQTYGSLFKMNIPDEDKMYKLEALLKKYPGTKYSPQLYNLFFRESKFINDYNKSTENISDFFDNNNDTYGAELILELGNHNLEKLSSRYRDTKTGYLIRQRKKEELTHK